MERAASGPSVKWRRLPLLGLGAAALVAALWSGLSRLGALPPMAPMAHGPLMVSGFLGTVIALERAVAARAAWAFVAPLACGVGGVLFLAGQGEAGAALWVLGSALVVVVLARVLWLAPALHHVVLWLSAVAWLVGNVALALGRPGFEVMAPWTAFLVGTIAAERLELTRVLPRSRRSVALFSAAMGLVFVGAGVTLAAPDAGVRVSAAGALGLSAWLFHGDVARRTVRQPGLVRFIAVALLGGYAWLGVSGALGLVWGNPLAGPRYDALLHSTFIGFVFSMIFGHAPVIVPAVLGVRVPFHGRFYVHLGLLHAALVVRLAGDLGGWPVVRQAGAWGNATAMLLFVGSTALAVRGRGKDVPVAPPRVATS